MAARRPLLLLMLPFLLAGEARLSLAEQRLGQQRFAAAIRLFQEELAADPTSGRARRGLGVARAGVQRCGSALPELAAARSAGAWDAEAALAEGDCWSRQGDASAAIAAWEEALRLDDVPQAWFKISQAEHARGDARAAAQAYEALAASEGAAVPNMLAIASTWQALSCDEGDAAWLALADLRAQIEITPSPGAQVEAEVIEGLLWMAAGDPAEAEATLRRGGRLSRSPARVAALRAEALRRAGDPAAALEVYDTFRAARGDLVLKLAVLARVQVDLGALDEAEALLDAHPDPADTALLASRWYLARARGDARAASEWARRWALGAPPSECPLSALVPLESP